MQRHLPSTCQPYRVIFSFNETVVWPDENTYLYFHDWRVRRGVCPLPSNPLLNLLPPYVVCGWQSNDGLLGMANQSLGPWAPAASSLLPRAGGLSCVEPPLEPLRRPIHIRLLSTCYHIFRQNDLPVGCSICTHALWQWVRLLFWVRGIIGGGRGARLGLSPQRAWEKRRNQATELLEIILKTSLLLPQVSTSQTTPESAHLPLLLAWSLH